MLRPLEAADLPEAPLDLDLAGAVDQPPAFAAAFGFGAPSFCLRASGPWHPMKSRSRYPSSRGCQGSGAEGAHAFSRSGASPVCKR